MHRIFLKLGWLARYSGHFLEECGWAYKHFGWTAVAFRARSTARNLVYLLKSRTSHRVTCPCCEWTGHDFMTVPGETFLLHRCECPRCGAQQRQRVLHQYILRHDPALLRIEGLVVHSAPEASMVKLLRRIPRARYLMIDIDASKIVANRGTGFRTDLRHLALPPDSVDFFLCLHVLEHIDDDRAAIAEIRRALKPGGLVYFMVPMHLDRPDTIEFGSARPEVYGHYRTYGRDFKDRLAAFDTREILPRDFLDEAESERIGSRDEEIIYRCTKP